jgi:hypothetical protein
VRSEKAGGIELAGLLVDKGANVNATGTDDNGRPVQDEPIKPQMKAPGAERLKLEYDKTLSSFAFNFNLRRYRMATRVLRCGVRRGGCGSTAGAYTRPLFGST